MTRVLITTEGGVITSVYATDPSVEYVVLDYDEVDPPDEAVEVLMVGFGHDAMIAPVEWPAAYRKQVS